MLQRVNVIKIIKDHLNTLRRIDHGDSGISFWDSILFIFFPLIGAGALALCHVSLTTHITDLITFVSIIGGFLLNLLAIIYGLMDKLREDSKGDDLKTVFVNEVHINISFNILLSLILLVSLLLYSYVDCNVNNIFKNVFYDALTGFIYFLLFTFLLTMFMILNRVYILLKKS